MQLVLGVGIEPLKRFRNCGARAVQVIRDGLLTRNDALQLLQAPLIGLVEVDARPHEEGGEELIALTPHRVFFGCNWEEILLQPAGQPQIALRGCPNGIFESIVADLRGDICGTVLCQLFKEGP